MEIDKLRVELPDKAWMVVYAKVLRRTHRLHINELIKFLKPVDQPKPEKLSEVQDRMRLDKPPEPTDFTIDTTGIDNDKINEIFIFNQIVEWSFGPVDYETLETKVNREQYIKMVEEMDRLFKPSPLVTGRSGNGSATTSSPLSSANYRPQSKLGKLITSLLQGVSRILKS